MSIDRYNGGTTRRYHFKNGSIGVVFRNQFTNKRFVQVLPAFCRHVAVNVTPQEMAKELLAARDLERKEKAVDAFVASRTDADGIVRLADVDSITVMAVAARHSITSDKLKS